MEQLHAIALTVGLFVLTFFNPGANLLVVAQTSLVAGRRAGALTGLGVALGDAIYSGLGLFGMAALIARVGPLLALIKIFGGAYLLWFAWQTARSQGAAPTPAPQQPAQAPLRRYLRNGLFTCLANPQTMLFFISIFSVTLRVDTPHQVKLLTWLGIVLSSLSWRLFLSLAFSLPAARRGYARTQRIASRAVGAIIGALALRLIYEGVAR